MPRFDTAAETRRILALAWPVMLTSLNWTLLQVTDVVVVGMAGAHEAAALSASRALTFVAIVTGLAWLSGVLVAASRADGAGDAPATGRALREGAATGLLLGILIGGTLLVAADPLLRLLGVAPALVAPGARVVRIMALAVPLQLLGIATGFFLEGISRPGRVAAVQLAVLPVNALLAWAWSGGHWGLPAMGAAGAAAATVVASALSAVGMVASALLLGDAGARGLRRFDAAARAGLWRGVGRLLRFGAVPAVASGLELAGFSVLIALSTRFGDAAAHAFQIIFAVHNVTFGVALGLGSAAGVRAGNAVGEGRPADAAARTGIAVALAAVALGAGVAVLLAGGRGIVAAFPAEPAVHARAGAMLAIWAPFIVFDGVQVVLVYALRSLGDQVAAGINSILAYFVVTGGVGLWLVAAGAGPDALAWASGGGMLAAALLHGGRFAIVARRLSAPVRPRS